jgi:hypothetical protein
MPVIGLHLQILFHAALNFSSDCPHPTIKFA